MVQPNQEASATGLAYTSEYNEFIEKLAAYHEKRGTEFVREPKVGSKHIDLLRLFNMVVERGGYDKVSEEKLAWRKVGQEFDLGTLNLPALAFTLKTVYYRNLAAYEISTIHKKEPPPKHILEDRTAKGGKLLTRTVENYNFSKGGGMGHDGSDGSGDDGTPVRDRNGSEETPGSGGRVTRGLRQAPPQRILFQPDTQSSRQTRHVSATSHASSPSHSSHHQQHQPRGASTSYNPSSMDSHSLAVANYEPRPQMPLTLRSVVTPGNNPIEFARRQKAKKDSLALASGKPLPPVNKGIMLPGSGFDGPNIYVRCLCALKSGTKSEQDYALHHLVKISMERGDKYRFESFSGLAEALIEKLLEVSSLFYEVDWQISYADDGAMTSINILNGLDGTPDILQRIAQLPKLDVDDNIQTAELSDTLLMANEAALTMRNMVMLEENAHYVSEMAPLRDFLSIALNLPKLDCVVELKHYALDIAEQLTKYMHFDETDPLYISLLEQLQGEDRGAILTALRAISRISMNLEENNLLRGVPVAVIQNIMDWTLLNDEEMVHACLDFLYQYTAVVDNVDFLITEVQVEPLINQLTRLLAYGAKYVERDVARGPDRRMRAPVEIASIPKDLLAQLYKLDEPERSSQWLRCLFEEDREESITQIALWQAYQARFTSFSIETGRPLLPAAEFIKNVSNTFLEKAAAQVQAGPVQKFIIKGIRMRSVPVDFKGEEYRKCLWRLSPELNTHTGFNTYLGSNTPHGSSKECGEFYMSEEEMYRHILRDHVHAHELENGKFDNKTVGQYVCLWDHCPRFKPEPATKLSQLATHIKVHLSPRPSATKESGDHCGPPPLKKLKPSYLTPGPKQTFQHQVTAIDERHDAAGIPLSAVLVLRNLARNLSKTESEDIALKLPGGVSWVDRLFKPVEPRLYEVMAHNRSLTSYMTDLISAINDS
ncbi:hypothetical protein G7Y89_g878 [Cudoniella acicularis]|uniref:ARID domain-containing protein n=1 Tax=Cudoniella acicularis TaxID=354080 RepID=A0A8H4W8G8_9HELO|nr:hypothetical protein G7Y89_g878 [Cudoniella acicularis]